MRRVLTTVIMCTVLALGATPTVAAAAPASVTTPPTTTVGGVRVGGDVGSPATLTADQIAAWPATTLPLAGPGGGTHGTVTGALLTDVLASAGPIFGSGKNAQLRAVVTVTGRSGWRTALAYGELDPGFGNHPALLTVDRGVVSLVVPGDVTRLRSVPRVTGITLTNPSPAVGTPPAGGLTVVRGARTVTLSAAALARLPRQTRTVTFLSGSGTQTHTESGPTLARVLLAAGFAPLPATVVTAVAGSDGYAATVTVGEALLGGRPLLISLTEDGAAPAQPRLVVDGDLHGGRYVSGVVTLGIS